MAYTAKVEKMAKQSYTFEYGHVRWTEQPKTLQDHRAYIEECLSHKDMYSVEQQRKWLVKIHGVQINKTVDNWIHSYWYGKHVTV